MNNTHFQSILFLLLLTISLSNPIFAEYDWVRVSTLYTPPRTDGQNIVFNSSEAICYMFGGVQVKNRSQPLYLYDGTNWISIQPEGSWPSWRSHFGMAYDASRDVVVIFGGFTGSSDYLGDTWEWDGSQWEEKMLVEYPRDRIRCSMTFFPVTNKVILFGGYTEDYVRTNDLWQWNGFEWIEVNLENSPGPRSSSPIVFDSAREKIVMFGGADTGYSSTNDTWEWDGENWDEIFPDHSPGCTRGHVLLYDSSREKCVLFGGNNDPYGLSNETWEYDGVDWQQINTEHQPIPRTSLAACYDVHRQRIVLYGGYTETGSNNETWEYYDVPIPTITPSPTVTPSPSPTPPPTVTPTSTATPQDGITLSLDLPDNPVHTGDAFYLDISINSNHSSDLSSMPMFCILEVAGSFWYYPTWEMTPSWETITVHPGNQIVSILPEFPWPADCGSGSARFWAALTDMEITRIFGNVDVRDVVWDPSLLNQK